MLHVNHREENPCFFGGTPEEGFDCSGFVTFLCGQIGFPLSLRVRHVNEFFDHRTGAFVQLGCQQEGDLVFFSRWGLAPSHMGIMLDRNYYIHSPGKDNRQIEITRLVVKPINKNPRISGEPSYNHNPIGFKRLAEAGPRWFRM